MIELRNIAVTAGEFRLTDVTLRVERGEYAVLMGRTASGKTTLLEAISGLTTPSAGRILLDDRDVTSLPPAERGVGYVPQDGALFHTFTVAEHLEFGPRFRGWSRRDRMLRVAELADELGIASLLHRRPKGLSGGERQRVALGRALAARPAILLLDEPLSAVDDETRASLLDLLARVTAGSVTTLHVTHSQHEAERLADRRLRLVDGRVAVEPAPTNA